MSVETRELEKIIDDEIEKKFEDFKESFFKRIRKPAIGLTVAIAALVAMAGVYVYIDAASKVYESRAELAKARTEFYESMMESQEEVLKLKNGMIGKFNDWAEDAEKSMVLMQEKLDEIQVYDEEFQAILERHRKAFKEGPHGKLSEEKSSLKDILKPKPKVIFKGIQPEIEKKKEPIVEEKEIPIEKEHIQLAPSPVEQKSYKIIDPGQMEQRTFK